ncbi:LysE family transporter [Halorubrum sp. JWXQ-INN 858]|uniref:LysE family translocator n=1 Tax=Halorubrum sp. JWXQ-INN 858 TaxID=2690782 RepID=UPI00135918E5|nr:LysE family translocator [Halorubrum sp. JWXQ-INN 858]MWV64718.1 LysE family transporter [Halorubrum sp. JWXQ-INN 858]
MPVAAAVFPEPSTYALFVLAAAALIVTPGPDTLFVLSRGLEGRSLGLRAACGVTAGILFHTALVVVGVAALYRSVPGAERIVGVLGGAYLCYLGIDTLRSAGETEPAGTGGVREGFLVNALNPQVALFFLAFLPGFAAGEEGGSVAALGVTYAALTAVYLGGVALAADGTARLLRSERTRVWLDRVAGAVLVGLGVWLIPFPSVGAIAV